MALPIIRIHSGTGSDSAASGAGPGDGVTSGSALTGSSAATDGAGTTVTLDSGTDLSNVLTDGSHVLYLNHSSGRNFGKITGKAGSGGAAPTVTVANAFAVSLSGKTWAIGGVRASVGGTASRKLLDNGGSAGDVLAGWRLRMLSGHAETLSSALSIRRGGDSTDGRVVLEGEPGAATRPVLTWSNNGNGVKLESVGYWLFSAFDSLNSNATKTASNAFAGFLAPDVRIVGVRIGSQSGAWWRATSQTEPLAGLALTDCWVTHCANDGVYGSDLTLDGCYVALNGGAGIRQNSGATENPLVVARTVVAANTGDGIVIGATGSNTRGKVIDRCTIAGNGGDGIDVGSSVGSHALLTISDCIVSGNGAIGVRLGAPALAVMTGMVFHDNTSGSYTAGAISLGETTADPQYADSSGGDYTPTNTALSGLTYPTTIGGATSYAYPGAIQPQASGGGGGGGTIVLPRGGVFSHIRES